MVITSIRKIIKAYFSKGHERSLTLKKNILGSFVFKGLSIAISLILVPLTINYINPDQYGIWLTLSSVIGWFSFFDIGLGNGLKNKLAETNALDDSSRSKIYVSTTYAILILISIIILITGIIANPFLNWSSILNISPISAIQITKVTYIIIIVFCVQFVLQLINTVLTANHLVSKVSLILLIGQAISLMVIYFLTKTTKGTLFIIVLVITVIPVIVQLIASIWYYCTTLKKFAPSFKFVDFKYAKDLLSLGGVFFFIQIGALFLFQTDNIIITQLFGPSKVTAFNVVYKLFSVVTMVFNIIMTPFWSSFTDAYAKNDTAWIKSVLKKMRLMWVLLSLSTLGILPFAPFIYRTWLHGTVSVPGNLSLAMAFYVIAYSWQTIHVFFLNGIGKIKLQLYLVVLSSVVNIPIAIFLGKRMGVAGVTLANGSLFLIMGIIFYAQTAKIVNGSAKGIFNA